MMHINDWLVHFIRVILSAPMETLHLSVGTLSQTVPSILLCFSKCAWSARSQAVSGPSFFLMHCYF